MIVPAIEAMANVKKQNRANLTEEKNSQILFFFFFILLQIKKILTDVLFAKNQGLNPLNKAASCNIIIPDCQYNSIGSL